MEKISTKKCLDCDDAAYHTYRNRCKKCYNKMRKEYITPEKRREYYQKRKESGAIQKGRLRLRFEIFSRDNFTCQYCGRKPPEVILEIDHIIPQSKGGSSREDNLKTACQECNLGKGNLVVLS